MHNERIPPSLAEVQNYHAYQMALRLLSMKVTEGFDEPVEKNPFDKDEYPLRHAFYEAIQKYGALKLFENLNLTDNTIDQYIKDDVLYNEKIKNAGDITHNTSFGSNTHLDFVSSYMQKHSDKNFEDATMAFMEAKQDLNIKDQLDFISPIIKYFTSHHSKDEEKLIQDMAIMVDFSLGHKLPYAVSAPNKNDGLKLNLSMPVETDDIKNQGTHLIRKFARKLGL